MVLYICWGTMLGSLACGLLCASVLISMLGTPSACPDSVLLPVLACEPCVSQGGKIARVTTSPFAMNDGRNAFSVYNGACVHYFVSQNYTL